MLLLFINARGRHFPDESILAVFQAARLAWTSQAVIPTFRLNYKMAFNGQRTPDTYGEMFT
jgi:hypothetical protein